MDTVNTGTESQLGIEIQLFLPAARCRILLLGFRVCVLGVLRPPGSSGISVQELRRSRAGQPLRQLLTGHLASVFAVARGLAESMDMQGLSYRGARETNPNFK